MSLFVISWNFNILLKWHIFVGPPTKEGRAVSCWSLNPSAQHTEGIVLSVKQRKCQGRLFSWTWSRSLVRLKGWHVTWILSNLVKSQPCNCTELNSQMNNWANSSKIIEHYSQMSCLLCVKTTKAFQQRKQHYWVLNRGGIYELRPWSCTLS
jgi:hypothetical protein